MLQNLKNKIIVSCQAMPDEPMYNETAMLAMMQSVLMGGAGGLRLAGSRDIKNIKRINPNVPVIGITKPKAIPDNFLDVVYITPTIADAKEVIDAGADIVAFDGTRRERPNGETLGNLIGHIKNSGKIAMADIATYEEAVFARQRGADVISTTLNGYTRETALNPPIPDFELLRRLSEDFFCPIILEGKIWTVEDAKTAFDFGAHCVVIGSAITRPQLIIKRFTEIFK